VGNIWTQVLDFCKLANMTEAQHIYFANVLGIKEFIHPTDVLFRAPFTLVYSPFIMTDEEQLMATKMIQAAKLAEPFFLSSSEDQMKEINGNKLIKAAIAFGLKPNGNFNVPWIELPAIHKFISETEVQQRNKIKREAWISLQKLSLKTKN
jgi:hypothetical protein